MAVVYVEELWSGRSGEDGIERKRSYTRTFEVRCEDSKDDPTIAGGTSLLPRNGSAYPSDPYARMVKIRPMASDSDPTLWTVTCDYSTELPGGGGSGTSQAAEAKSLDPETGETKPQNRDPGQREENPLDRPATYKWSHEKHTEPATHTYDGTPILNCADEPYDPPIEAKRSNAVLTITRNYAFINMEWLERFLDSVNITKFYGRKKRTWFIDGIDADSQSQNGVGFWQVVYRLLYNRRTHDHIVMERGWNEKKQVASSTWERTPIPVPVDQAGRAGDQVPLLDGGRASGFNYDSDYVKAVDGPVGGNKDGSNPEIKGVSYVSGVGLGGTLNDGTIGRGMALGKDQAPFYSRWRVQPEVEFRLLGI